MIYGSFTDACFTIVAAIAAFGSSRSVDGGRLT